MDLNLPNRLASPRHLMAPYPSCPIDQSLGGGMSVGHAPKDWAEPPTSAPLGSVDRTTQAHWQERAAVSRAYARILLSGGSLG